MQLLLEALTYHRGSDEPLSVVVILVVRVTLVVATGWLAARAFSRSWAAVEHRIWLLAALGTLVVPLLWALTPRWRLPLLALHVQGTRPAGFAYVPVTAESAWPELLVAVWITGALAGLAYIILGIVLARRLFAGSLPCRDAAWLDALASVQRQMRWPRRVELRMAPCSMSPAVWSFRRARILVPAESLAWPLDMRRSVLLHELAHVARRDCMGQLIASLACAVWWFHPLVWYAAGRVRALAEQAADDCVIRAGKRRADYAEVLLTIASSLGWARLPAVAQAMFHPSHLERRLRAILDPTRRRNALGARLSVASTLVACALMILLATLTSSVVRSVPQPSAEDGQRPGVDIHLNVRMTAPVEPVGLRTDYQYRPFDPRFPAQGQIPVAPPPSIFQLVPNWDMGRHAEMLIPNYQHGMAQTLLVEQLPAPAAAPAGDVVRQAARAAALR
jgi:beta-lactamase regulating signal transducer with metallopeptidase domain